MKKMLRYGLANARPGPGTGTSFQNKPHAAAGARTFFAGTANFNFPWEYKLYQRLQYKSDFDFRRSICYKYGSTILVETSGR